MTKLLAAIKAKTLRQVVPPIGRFACVELGHEMAPTDRPNHFAWKISAEVLCGFSGPFDAKQHLLKQAMRLIAKEVYGEIADDLHELLRILMEEHYRGAGDPALKSIYAMLNKISGDS